MSDLMPLCDADYRFVAELLYRRAGIRMGEQKRPLIASRLAKRVRTLGFSSFAEYFSYLEARGGEGEMAEFLNLLTTNHSYFYREPEHYEFLATQVLAPIKERAFRGQGERLRIWSAGCATGEEPYAVAMTIASTLGEALGAVDVGVLATDISRAALAEALRGVYPASRLKDLPRAYAERFLEPAGPEHFAVRSEVRALVLFKRLNLMEGNYPFRGGFDVVFCRNVMIYFDEASRRALVAALYRVIKAGGYLFIGHSETIRHQDCPFAYVKPAIYRKEVEA